METSVKIRKRFLSWYATLFLLSIFASTGGFAQNRRAIVPQDCVTVRYLYTDNSGQPAIRLNPQSSLVAYLVKSPNLAGNRNDIQLYVKDLTSGPSDQPKLLLSSPVMSQFQWLNDGKRIVVLAREGRSASIIELNAETSKRRILVQVKDDIKEFSINNSGDVVVFATEAQAPQQEMLAKRTEAEISEGYRIPFEVIGSTNFYRRNVFMSRRRRNSTWTVPRQVLLTSPFTKRALDSLAYIGTLHLSVSPDGKSLLLNYVDTSDGMPAAWKANSYVRMLKDGGFSGVLPTLLVDLISGSSSLAIESPWISNTPFWSADSRSFVLSAISPIGSKWEEDDRENHRLGGEAAHLFSVDRVDGTVHLVTLRTADSSKPPLCWKRDGSLILHTDADTIGEFLLRNGSWIQRSSFRVALQDFYRFSELASDGDTVVGDHQNAMTPPEVFRFNRTTGKVVLIARLNPQFDFLSLAPIQEIGWTTSTGYGVRGFLFLPPQYIKGMRYPLVIQTKPDQGQFVCDTGPNHYPSFAPQPIANAGMMYLARTIPASWNQKDEQDHYPKGYPGGIAEAAFQTDLWDSAVKALDERGLIDPDRVGIIGFSRSGWYTEFALTHSSVRYRAATLTDNVQYSLSEYWMLHSAGILHGWDTMYAGPPYGESLKNWLAFSISFNLDRIHAPILMEEMGYGVPFDNPKAPPLSLAAKWELFTGLNRLGKPVELYYYPNEVHQPDHPKARLATLQRNLDWYRFWLQDYERPQPSDTGQYIRWRHLRELLQR